LSTSSTIPNLHEYLRRGAERRPEAMVLISAVSGRAITYAELLARACGAGTLLRECDVGPGDRIALYLDNSFEYAAFYFGALGIGAVAVPLNAQLLPASVAPLLAECGAKAIVAGARHCKSPAPLFAPGNAIETILSPGGVPAALPEGVRFRRFDFGSLAGEPSGGGPASDDPALILYTSGTEGPPKGVVLSHANLAANTESILAYLGLGPDDSQVAVLPWAYSYGNSVLLTHIAAGARLVIDNRVSYPSVIVQTMERERVTGFSGVHSHYALLVHKSDFCRRGLPFLRYATCAGGPFARPLIEALRRSWPAIRIFCMYGQTEASARLASLPPERLDDKPGSIGIPIPGVDLRVLRADGSEASPGEVGELVARGPNIMRGYFNAPEKTAEVLRPEGLWTGDMAWRDEDGFFFIAGRKKDIIKTGGHRVSPHEIEEAMLRIEGVIDCAVAGVPDSFLGEAVGAVIVLGDGAALSAQEVRRRLRAVLDTFKIPSRIEFAGSVPRTAAGKIDKDAIRARLRDAPGDSLPGGR